VRLAHRHPLVLVDILGALGIVGDIPPVFILKIVTDLLELDPSSRNHDFAPRLSKCIQCECRGEKNRGGGEDKPVRRSHNIYTNKPMKRGSLVVSAVVAGKTVISV
jgi:hypothetical protein